ncbi:MAG: type I restriction endonuclease [Faecalibacillus faecis]
MYQVVNQIERPKIVDGKPNRRFDVTLLINGLPIIQIELKAMHSTNESLNQMKQYIAEKQYSGIFLPYKY